MKNCRRIILLKIFQTAVLTKYFLRRLKIALSAKRRF
jgi:hypothetical protein